MKTKNSIIDDDYIGGLGSLTHDEEKALTDYFTQKKLSIKKPLRIAHHRTFKHQKATV
jgi:hypothetical protein